MVLESYSSTCPGSLMVMGEHAVLYGSPAIVVAIDKYLTVTLTVTPKQQAFSQVSVSTDINKFSNNPDSESYLEFNIADIENIHAKSFNKFVYILAVIKHFKNEITISGLDYKFNITSEINPSMGLGSSAAITVASIDVLLQALGLKENNAQLLTVGRVVIENVQGKGSGADLAASIYGKVIIYQPADQSVEIIADSIPLTVVYCGYKLSTKEVVRIIADKIKNNSQIYKDIFILISKIVQQAKVYIVKQNWLELGQLFNQHYGLQEALGTSDQTLANIVYNLRNDSNIYGAKISGSGLGDCVIGLGKISDFNNKNCSNSQLLDINMSSRGLSSQKHE